MPNSTREKKEVTDMDGIFDLLMFIAFFTPDK